jgi:spore germination protein GerM
VTSRSVWVSVAILCVASVPGCGSGATDEPANVTATAGGPAQPLDPEVALRDTDTSATAVVPRALSRMNVTLYFPSSAADGLRGESREIFQTASPVERAKQILSDLIEGPADDQALAALPRGTRVRQVFVLQSGLAYADFSSELRDGLNGGTADELHAVYAIVNSLALNVPEITRVAILIEGEPAETLGGHLDLRKPLGPRPSLEAVEDPDAVL